MTIFKLLVTSRKKPIIQRPLMISTIL